MVVSTLQNLVFAIETCVLIQKRGVLNDNPELVCGLSDASFHSLLAHQGTIVGLLDKLILSVPQRNPVIPTNEYYSSLIFILQRYELNISSLGALAAVFYIITCLDFFKKWLEVETDFEKNTSWEHVNQHKKPPLLLTPAVE